MHHFRLTAPCSELREFPHIVEFGCEKYDKVRFGSLTMHRNPGIEICFIISGKFVWAINERRYELLPGDGFMTLPWQEHGGPEGFMDIGSIYWIVVRPEVIGPDGTLKMGSWCPLLAEEAQHIGRALTSSQKPVLGKAALLGERLGELAREVLNRPPGYLTRVNLLLTDLLILTGRMRRQQAEITAPGCPDLATLDAALSAELDRDWTLGDMAAVIGKKPTSFTCYIKAMTGCTAVHYLTELRIDRARQLLQQTNEPVQAIGYGCGFKSAQYFSNTFKLRTGYTPQQFREKSAGRSL